MKTKILTLCLFALFQFSCSTDDDNGNNDDDNSSTEVIPTDLLDYYVVFETSSMRCYVLYFTEDNGSIMANVDGLGVHRGMEVTSLTKETLEFEYNEGVILNFSFDKNNDDVMLTDYSTEGTESSITHAQSDKTANAPVFYKPPGSNDTKIWHYTKTETFCGTTDTEVYLYFDYNNEHIWKHDGACGPSAYWGYYFIGGNPAWKSDGENTFGAVINNWKGSNEPTMVLETFVDEMQPGKVHTAYLF
ncbi:hypothetical protein [Sinomicrobium soli]|uniref:hypothetical protein n=1 Tax=Sinomicrobium sp. N-1-3-6 TaxID=2219864 RepID=UPI000DCE7B1C|nr:hypothetical protein [Sinomicrobium sp. N-1-3-6]RAV27470.1 hypothetical protein DN748_18535 [Sinomicrobium sp. N-1-3-6]